MEEIRVSVVVPTRNRPDQIGACVESILANTFPSFELVVVDQSDDGSTNTALAPFLQDPRLRYIASESRGAAAARNVGISNARGALLAFTDDDCRVPADWIAQIVMIFDADADAGVLFGRVTIPEELKGLGFAADYEPSKRFYQGSFPAATDNWGIGANMSVRRRVFDQVGVFDVLLGPGATFKAGEEVDFAIRAIAAGWKVVNPHEVSLLHLGVRTGDAARSLLLGYLFATGAVFTKHLRLRTRGGVPLFANFLALHTKHTVDSLIRGRRPTGMGSIVSLLKGASRSLAYAVDHDEQVYVPRPR